MARVFRSLWFSLIFLLAGACVGEVYFDQENLDPTPSKEASRSLLLENAGFESGFTGWTRIAPTALSGVPRSGAQSAKLSSPTGEVKRTITGLEKGTSYVLSAWILGSAKIGVRHGGAEVHAAKSAGSWSQVSVAFTTGPSSTSAEIYAAWSGGGDARVDDFTLANSRPSACSVPAELLELTNWKVTLPIGSPTEIKQPELATYAIDPWFRVNSKCTGVRFRAHTSGSTTSGSGYPRSELREMTNGGKTKASWSTTSGTHRMYIDQAITAVPKGKKHVVAGQIHDGSDDVIVIRLEYPKLFVDINGKAGPTLDSSYTLGKRFQVEFVATGGTIRIYYNGASTPAHTHTQSAFGCYFKAGVYTQSNCSRESSHGTSCGTDNFGEVEIYDLWVQHE
jgi:hypothetical protein